MAFILAIDAGHGMITPGKRCSPDFDAAQTHEWQLNARVADKLTALLVKYNIQLLRVDDPTGGNDVGLSYRCERANAAKADMYLSIHHNAGTNGTESGGLEVYRHPNCSYNSQTSVYQRVVYDNLIAAGIPKGNRSEPIKTADFQVLRSTNMPAVLCELGFMDSAIDTPMILTDEFADKAARGLCEAIIGIAGLSRVSDVVLKPLPASPEPKPCAAYQVYTATNKWLPNVVDDSDFAGVSGRAIQGVYVNLSEGSVVYQVHTLKGKWLPWVMDRQDYAGVLGKRIDAIRVKLADNSAFSIECRVAPVGSGYYPWVRDNNDYAGMFGKPIDRLQIRVINR